MKVFACAYSDDYLCKERECVFVIVLACLLMHMAYVHVYIYVCTVCVRVFASIIVSIVATIDMMREHEEQHTRPSCYVTFFFSFLGGKDPT